MNLSENPAEPEKPPAGRPVIDNRRRSGDDKRMEARLSKLELLAEKSLERTSSLELDLAVIKSNYATKEDLAKTEATLLKWFIATAVTMVSLAFAAAKFIH